MINLAIGIGLVFVLWFKPNAKKVIDKKKAKMEQRRRER